MADFQIPKNALLPLLTATLTDEVGPIDLSGATVKFQMRVPGSSALKVDTAATIIGSPINGQVRYNWLTADVDTIGIYIGWFLVTYSGSGNLHAPEPPLIIAVTRGASGAG